MGEKKQEMRLRFGSNEDDTSWSITNPYYEPLRNAMWKLRYDLKGLTQGEAYLVASAAEDYCHLCTHPMGTEKVIKQLRAIRNAIKDE